MTFGVSSWKCCGGLPNCAQFGHEFWRIFALKQSITAPLFNGFNTQQFAASQPPDWDVPERDKRISVNSTTGCILSADMDGCNTVSEYNYQFLCSQRNCVFLQYGLTPVILGLVFLVGPGVYALTAPMWGWIVDRTVRILLFFPFWLINFLPTNRKPKPSR